MHADNLANNLFTDLSSQITDKSLLTASCNLKSKLLKQRATEKTRLSAQSNNLNVCDKEKQTNENISGKVLDEENFVKRKVDHLSKTQVKLVEHSSSIVSGKDGKNVRVVSKFPTGMTKKLYSISIETKPKHTSAWDFSEPRSTLTPCFKGVVTWVDENGRFYVHDKKWTTKMSTIRDTIESFIRAYPYPTVGMFEPGDACLAK